VREGLGKGPLVGELDEEVNEGSVNGNQDRDPVSGCSLASQVAVLFLAIFFWLFFWLSCILVWEGWWQPASDIWIGTLYMPMELELALNGWGPLSILVCHHPTRNW